MAKSNRPNQRTRAKRAAQQAAQQQARTAQNAQDLAPANDNPADEVDLIELSPVTKARLKALSIPHELAFRSNLEHQKAWDDRANIAIDNAEESKEPRTATEAKDHFPALKKSPIKDDAGPRTAGIPGSDDRSHYMYPGACVNDDSPNIKPRWSKVASARTPAPASNFSKALDHAALPLMSQEPTAKGKGKTSAKNQGADLGANNHQPKGKGKGKATARPIAQDEKTNDWEAAFPPPKRLVLDEPIYRTERPAEWPSYNPSASFSAPSQSNPTDDIPALTTYTPHFDSDGNEKYWHNGWEVDTNPGPPPPPQRPWTKCVDHYYDMASGRTRLRSIAERRAMGLIAAPGPLTKLERDHWARVRKQEREADPEYIAHQRRVWPTPARPLDLYRFPAEIRTLILRHVLTNDLPIPVTPLFRRLNKNMKPACDYRILHSCHELYVLGLPLYYQLNTFSMSLHDFGVTKDSLKEGNWPRKTGQQFASSVQGVRKLHLTVRTATQSGGVGYDWQYAIQCLRGFEGLRKVVLDVRMQDAIDGNEGGVMLEGSSEGIAARSQRKDGMRFDTVSRVFWVEVEVGSSVTVVVDPAGKLGNELIWNGKGKEGEVVVVPVAEGLREMLEKGGVRIGGGGEDAEDKAEGSIADGCLFIGANDEEEAALVKFMMDQVHRGLDRHLAGKGRN